MAVSMAQNYREPSIPKTPLGQISPRLVRVFPRPFTHGGDLSPLPPNMRGQVQEDKALMGGLMREDIDLVGRGT